MRIALQRDAADHFVIRRLAVTLVLELVGGQFDDRLGAGHHVEPAIEQLGLLAGGEILLDHVFLGFIQQDIGLGIELV